MSASASPSASPSGSPSCSAQSLSCGMASTGTLYLLTFVGTLVVLLSIAALMIARGAYRRRRLRALGLWPPQPTQIRIGVRRRETVPLNRPRPQIWDVYLDAGKAGSTEGTWDAFSPLSAMYVPTHEDELAALGAKPTSAESPSSSPTPSPPIMPMQGPSASAGLFVALLQRPPRPPRPALPATPSALSPIPIPRPEPLATAPENALPLDDPSNSPPPIPAITRLACIITMPVPRFNATISKDGDSEAYMPFVELGVAHVEVHGVCNPDVEMPPPPPVPVATGMSESGATEA